MRDVLIPHPRTPCEAVDTLTVEVRRDAASSLSLRFRLTGDLTRLAIPPATPARRTDGLWTHTCFEAFVAGPQAGYVEFNLSPSTAWAAYAFDDYRLGMRLLEVEAPGITVTHDASQLEVAAVLSGLQPGPCRLGLSAVIEDQGGRLSYWALAHPADDPDFHHPDSFTRAL